MLFNSLLFIFLFAPLFFLVYFTAPISARNAICLGFSLIFYAWAEPIFIFVVAASSAADHWLVCAMVRSRSHHITASHAERARLDAELGELFDEVGAVGEAEIALPYVTRAYRGIRP